ncbi:unnamed protein product [Acanthoscelides obtectus]|uniref:DUF7869 domain-containing protein n=1 Tax=Acanthoscelides obtectus TaxID=200917 RepID=A0A9P0QDT6_ACAOB|nr:unnamed protein product [Acanthoscelides obtectus]CAK1687953.1 hypothetical protein AOBTE_LOCUS36472 [Acanthoscelides obtectus]
MNRGKKRKLKIDTWKQTVRKHQRDAGEAYISSRNVPKAALSQPEERGPEISLTAWACDHPDSMGYRAMCAFFFRNVSANVLKPPEDVTPICSLEDMVYHDIFKSKFNLRFGLPRSDTCSYCDKLFMKLCSTDDANEKKKIEIESEIHHRKAEAGYKTLKDDTETSKLNPNYVVLCTDLQQVLFCPNLTHSSVFYQRQFSTYNYAVHNMGEENATMLLWHEAMAHRGSTEIASALLFYITNKYSRLKAGEERRKLVVWSDRCVGQNNNWKMLTMLRLLVLEKFFTQVEQKFLTSGHSFLPCDRDFSLIDDKKKSLKYLFPHSGLLSLSRRYPIHLK